MIKITFEMINKVNWSKYGKSIWFGWSKYVTQPIDLLGHFVTLNGEIVFKGEERSYVIIQEWINYEI